MKYIVIDFETSGKRGSFPTQVSVDSFNPLTGEVTHLYDSFVKGAFSLSDWVQQNTSVTMEKLEHAPSPSEVSEALADLYEEGDIVVAHNVAFDLGVALPRIAGPTHPLLNAPVIDTMRERWAFQIRGKVPRLKELCVFLDVEFKDSSAHDATYDTRALAKCMQAACDRGLTWTIRTRKTPTHKSWFL